ncbi:ceramide glucosyltransferase [Stigmatella erecta]|uniref:Ceramide glucosyltransferase n=1 Tax=Stigmatella erecta TaxID=83460 RepID=A0A1I0JB72_9BACT|nr:ceramide glucosyltransferase [Stigmatella erecta]SEU06587.1 ceramide glucosyltransferase [Stigmatella erecta]
MPVASLLLFSAAALGLLALAVQFLFVLRHRPRSRQALPQTEAACPGISILKPLCGVDDDLEANLEQFATLDYPRYEVILGVKDRTDPAHALARAAVARWPHVMKLAIQEGEPGLNPKVNQLITLSAEARYDLWVISDSNVRVSPGYLQEIADGFEDPETGCVTHPIAGIGERTVGSLMDNLHLASSAAAGVITAKHLAGKDIVVGKSMALRREDVEALGGFFSVKDVLAEDFVIGLWITGKLGKRVVVARTPIFNVSLRKRVGDFFKRYMRWSVIHHMSVSTPTYLAQGLLNPAPLALLAALLAPSPGTFALAGAVACLKALLDVAVLRLLRPEPVSWGALPVVFLKDALLFVAWCNGLFSRTVQWRGTRLRVLPGTRLAPEAIPSSPALVPAEVAAREELLAG